MNLIIPMAGRGSRLRPHSLTIPKPMLPIAGKPIVQHLVEDLAALSEERLDEIHFIIGDFGEDVEKQLLEIASGLGAKGFISYQDQPLGTAHAILCGEAGLKDHVIVAFADTIFRANFKIDTEQDGIIWTKKVEDPSAFGVVKLDENDVITDFVEKPQEFVSDEAIIGIYFFNDGENLKQELQYLIDNDIREKGEYQLTNALENMKNKGAAFKTGTVDHWLDCGNKDAVLDTNMRVLEWMKDDIKTPESVELKNSKIIQPCLIGDGTVIENSTVGPHVTIGKNCRITDAEISNTLIQNDTEVSNINLKNTMLGNHVRINGSGTSLSLGDYSFME